MDVKITSKVFINKLIKNTRCIKKNGAHLLCQIISKLLKLRDLSEINRGGGGVQILNLRLEMR